ncbi:blue light receptor [Rhizopus stolonifer]|uniref:Blue light receptor n=2 Tax=Mucorineae TaxID=1344963 RepID=A0A367K4X4_RHIST|nr:blue light receptor [Rhizopus stolonifer]
MPNAGPAEFTRRKNWSQNILEELRDVIHVLSSDLNILYCSPASREFLGYQPNELMGRSFTEFVHVDDVDVFAREFRTSQNNGSVMRVTYRFLRKDGKHTTLETRGHFFKQGFFGSARSVPAETTRMMDTFLDYKMENEMLKRKVAIAKAKANQTKNKKQHIPSPQSSTVSSVPSDDFLQQQQENDDDDFEDEFEDLFSSTSNAYGSNVYTQGVLNSYDLSESVSLLTGLHFDLGERSRGISMGVEGELFNAFPSAIGDPASSMDDKFKTGKKRRNDDDIERICTDCGRTDAPEWRKGPKGPKTLCNACGLRWAKNNKTQADDMQS